ncbi:MAG: amidophosphoribosyltransferase [Oceanococcus sp.]
MCGIVGIAANRGINQEIYDALTVLQHRGQDAAGIMTVENGELFLRKENGLVRDVFGQNHMDRLRGHIGIGHVRYPTAGCASSAEAQPFYVNSPYGISLSHNGNLTNAAELRQALYREDRRHLNTNSDSEILLNVLAGELSRIGSLTLKADDVFEAIAHVHKRCRGAYACVAMIHGLGIVGFRDPYGIRPAVYGVRETSTGREYLIASESVALDVLGFELIADIAPGEAVIITEDGQLITRQCAENPRLTPCIFEHVYLARPDSIIDDIYVYKARLRMGDHLAHKIKTEWPDHDIDVVIPVPDTSRTAADQLAGELGVKYREGFIKNRYIGRTFIMPGQEQRKKSVRQKLNPIDLEFQGKNVLLVDDSIVRGTTSKEIIQMARDAGAAKVYFASAAPPVRYPNVYGIDMPTASELVAHDRSVEDVQTLLGADKLIYQDIEGLREAVRAGNPQVTDFEDSVFTGEYVTQDVSEEYLNQLELFRSDSAKQGSGAVGNSNHIDLHNPG